MTRNIQIHPQVLRPRSSEDAIIAPPQYMAEWSTYGYCSIPEFYPCSPLFPQEYTLSIGS